MRMRFRFVLLPLVLLVGGVSASFSQTECSGCSGPMNWCDELGGEHILSSTGCAWKGYHANCLYCLGGWCHDGCGFEEALLNGAEVQGIHQRVTQAARERNVNLLVALAPQARRFIAINIERNAIQVRDCAGKQIIASLPVAFGLANLSFPSGPPGVRAIRTSQLEFAFGR